MKEQYIVYIALLHLSVSVVPVRLNMGCICAKEEKQVSKVQTCKCYVETNLDPVPKWAERDWETLLWRNNMSSDQNNIDEAIEKLKDGEEMLQNDRDNFDEMVSDINGKMLERQMSLTINQDILKKVADQIHIREEEF